MSCTIKEDLIKKYSKKYNPAEGKQIAEGIYEYIHTPEFTRDFGDFTKGFTKDTTQLKDGYPTIQAIEDHFKRKGVETKEALPKAYIDYVETYTPKDIQGTRDLILKKTQIAYNNIAREAAEIQKDFDRGRTLSARNKTVLKARERLKKQLEVVLKDLKTKTAEAGLVGYIQTVDAMVGKVEDILKSKLNLGVFDYYQNLRKFKYFSAIEDVIYVIENQSPAAKKVLNDRNIKYNELLGRIGNIKKGLIEGYVDVIGEDWGTRPAKMHRLAERRFRNAFEKRSSWMRANPGSTKADYNTALENHVRERMEAEKATIQQSEKDYIKDLLVNKAQDISFLDSLLGNPRDLTDDLIQIAVEMLDTADYNVMRETINKTKEGYDIYQRFIQGKDTRNMEKLYERLLGKDEEGNTVQYLIGKYRSQFYIERKELVDAIKKAEEDKGTDSKEAREARQAYKKWSKVNQVRSEENFVPASKWLNKDFEYFADKNNKGQADYDMYQFLVGLAKQRDANYLGHPARLRLPAIEKSGLENSFENGIASWVATGFGDVVKVRASDIDLHKENPDDVEVQFWNVLKRQIKVLVDEDSTELRTIPTYFRNYNKVNTKTQSYDLLSIYLMDFWGSTNYAEKTKVLPDLEVFKESLATRKVIQRTFGGKVKRAVGLGPKDDTLATVPGDQSNAYKALSSMIEDRLYGIRSLGSPLLQKLTSSLMGYTGNLFLIGNYFSAGASVFQGKTMTFIESVGGVDFSKKDVLSAEAKYDADIINMMADVGKIVPNSKTNLLSEIFESTQDFTAVAKKFAGATRTSQLANTNSLHFITNIAEHYIQNTLMYSFLQGIKVKNSKGEYINNKGEVVENRDDAMSYDEAYEVDSKDKAARLKIKSGLGISSIELKSGIEISLKDRRKAEFEVKRYLNHLNRRLNGNYTDNNQAMAQRHAMGKLAFLLRKWLEPGIRRRYRGIGTVGIPAEALTAEDIYYNREIQDLDEGTYTTTARFFTNLVRNLKSFSLEMMSDNWALLSNREKANIKKTITEMAIMVISAIGGGLVFEAAKDEPDEKKKAAMLLGAFYMRRLYSELRSFTSPTEFLRILQSPAASISLIQSTIEVFNQLGSDIAAVSTGGEFERYVQGKRKGQLKLEKEFRDLVPIWYQTGRKLDEAVGFLYKPVK